MSQSSTVPHCFLCSYGVASSQPLNAAPSPENIWGGYCTTLLRMEYYPHGSTTKGGCREKAGTSLLGTTYESLVGQFKSTEVKMSSVFCLTVCRLEETLEAAEDIAIDIPHIWLYLAELITPMLHEGGIPMGQLFR